MPLGEADAGPEQTHAADPGETSSFTKGMGTGLWVLALQQCYPFLCTSSKPALHCHHPAQQVRSHPHGQMTGLGLVTRNNQARSREAWARSNIPRTMALSPWGNESLPGPKPLANPKAYQENTKVLGLQRLPGALKAHPTRGRGRRSTHHLLPGPQHTQLAEAHVER